MVRVCAVFKCHETSEFKTPNVSFHAFPKDPEWRRQWVEAINRPSFVPNKNSYICSKHFEKDCVVGNRLQKGSCPTILEVPDITLMKHVLREKLIAGEQSIEENVEITASCSKTDASIAENITTTRGVQIHYDSDQSSSSSVSDKHQMKKFRANVEDYSISRSSSNTSEVIPIPEGIGNIPQKRHRRSSSSSTISAPETQVEIRKQKVMKKMKSKRYYNPKYVGDCLSDDMDDTSSKSKRNWQIAKQQIDKQRKKIAYLNQRRRRMERHVRKINGLLKELKNKFHLKRRRRIQRTSE